MLSSAREGSILNFAGRFCFQDRNMLLRLCRSSGLTLNLRGEPSWAGR